MDEEIFALLLGQVEETRRASQEAKQHFLDIVGDTLKVTLFAAAYEEFTRKTHSEVLIRLHRFLLEATITGRFRGWINHPTPAQGLTANVPLAKIPTQRAKLIRAVVEKSPDGNFWVTIRDAETNAILRSASGPYTDVRHFLDAFRILPATREVAEELHDVAKRTGQAISGPLRIVAGEY
jgi:hypothetical protein